MRRRSFTVEQRVVVDENVMVAMVAMHRSLLIAPHAEIASTAGAAPSRIIKASDAREVQTFEPQPAILTPNIPSLDDVIECQNFVEIQCAVSIFVEFQKHVGMNPVIPPLVQEINELVVVYPAIAVPVHRPEKPVSLTLKLRL